ncbi:hypothetical protein [Nocardioides marmotae]|uniref:hypothetical protein n=1 Tax=Nocardioides marmotae TaxID=2663857 RepID=UPI0012B55EBB|nr:hypothetical protein [Nocardioides marmotae]MBC9733945.1 hypothetical protein [Nocardioides marmotae]MTB85048.1 hypothetical protein [Nocardioides marmotae]
MRVDLALWGGGALAAVGVVAGLRMALADGEQTTLGVAVVALSLLLWVLLWLTCAVARNVGSPQGPEPVRSSSPGGT